MAVMIVALMAATVPGQPAGEHQRKPARHPGLFPHAGEIRLRQERDLAAVLPPGSASDRLPGECPKNRIIRAPDGEPGLDYLGRGFKQYFAYAISKVERICADLRKQPIRPHKRM